MTMEELCEALASLGMDCDLRDEFSPPINGRGVEVVPTIRWHGNGGDNIAFESTRKGMLYVTAYMSPKQLVLGLSDGEPISESEGCRWCLPTKFGFDGPDVGFDGQKTMATNHGWQRIRYCPNCGRRIQ